MRYSLLLREIVRRIAASSEPYWHRVVALNLLYETRTVPESETSVEGFLDRLGSVKDIERLSSALELYLSDVRNHPEETFLRRENDSNVVPLKPGELVHVWNVEAFLTSVTTHEDEPAVAQFLERNRLAPTPSDLRPWLARLGSDQARLRDVLGLRTSYRMASPRHPTWAVRWEEARGLIDENDANTWLNAVGLTPLSTGPQILALVRYSADRVQTILRRPTQFEAGWFALHFPSPPCAKVERGGFAMWTDLNPLSQGLVSEYIHPEIDWSEADVLQVRPTRPVSARDLQVLRANHFRRLQLEFGPELVPWMEDVDGFLEAKAAFEK